MVDAFTDITSGASLGLNLVKTGYDKAVAFKLRSEPLFRRVADTRPTNLTNPGESVVFNLYNDMAATEVDLDEVVSPDAKAVPSTSTVTVTLKECGDVVIPTLRLRTLSFADIDPAVANIVARHQADSIDKRVLTVLRGGTNVVYSAAGAPTVTGPTNTVSLAAGDTFKSAIPAAVVARMRGDSVIERMNMTFVAFVHPNVAHDLRRETGELGWSYPHAHSAAKNLWLAHTGVFGGVTYVETPRTYKANDGTSSDTVHRSFIMGSQALAEVVAIEPHSVIGPVTDSLARHRPLGWHGLLGWSRYREEALWRVETASTLQTAGL